MNNTEPKQHPINDKWNWVKLLGNIINSINVPNSDKDSEGATRLAQIITDAAIH